MQALWAVHLFLTPLYLFKSGLPQPADVIALVPAALSAMFYIVNTRARPSGPFLPLSLFMLLVGLVNVVHFMVLPDSAFLKSILFYGYNALIFGFGCLLLHEDPRGTVRVSIYGFAAALFMQLAVVLVAPAHNFVRESGWFNNPNQLGYWALLSLACVAVLRGQEKLRIIDVVLCGVALLLALFSTSKAALACFAILVPLILLGPQSRPLWRLVTVVSVAAALAFSIMHWGGIGNAVNQVHVLNKTVERFAMLGQDPDDSLEGRGYDRISTYPAYIFLGAGEGGYARFASGLYHSIELHSGLGTVLFCYGIAGLALILWFFAAIMRHARLYEIVIGILPLIYGLTHQNMRFTTFWILLALIYMAARQRRVEKAGLA